MILRIVLLSIVWATWWVTAIAQEPSFLAPIDHKASVCPASHQTDAPPDFSSKDCGVSWLHDIDPQGRLVWVQLKFDVEDIEAPVGFHLSGKLSSIMYLNGVAIGSNGRPSENAEAEIPGQMDSVFPLPQSLLREGENEIVLQASSHLGVLKLAHPIHMIALGPILNPQDRFLKHYWLSLPTAGVFTLALFYFATSAALKRHRTQSIALFAMCSFAIVQLMAEVSRGLIAYLYPVHDIRLIAITISSAGVGLSLSFLVASIFIPNRAFVFTAIAGSLSALSIVSMTGFDQKAAAAMLAPMLISLVLLGERALRGNTRATAYAAMMSVFVGTNLAFLSDFLDVVFFYVMAIFLVGLLTEQVFASARDENARRDAERRAEKLEIALDQAQQTDQSFKISIKSLGRIETVTADQIVQINSSGGYANILMLDGREILHSQSLAELESVLPNTFVRVHRSCLVNVRHVSSLMRNKEGNGVLIMNDGSEAPVSRRIMPSIRTVIGQPSS